MAHPSHASTAESNHAEVAVMPRDIPESRPQPFHKGRPRNRSGMARTPSKVASSLTRIARDGATAGAF